MLTIPKGPKYQDSRYQVELWAPRYICFIILYSLDSLGNGTLRNARVPVSGLGFTDTPPLSVEDPNRPKAAHAFLTTDCTILYYTIYSKYYAIPYYATILFYV